MHLARSMSTDVPAIAAREQARRERLRRWSHLLDACFRIPGTRIRFGLDPILGVFPGIGDLATPAFSMLLLLHACRLRIPRIVQARMVLNVVIDMVVGAVPIAGDLFDAGWKANLRNLRLLEAHARADREPSAGDWLFVVGLLALIGLCAAIPILLVVWAIVRFGLV
jgi:hypothetical protein